MFTTVLKTHVSDGKYYFLTQNSGNDTAKSPLGMFADFAIDNDLKYVDAKIRNYYQIGEYVSDEEIARADQVAARPEIEKGAHGRIRRTTGAPARVTKPAEKPAEKSEDKPADGEAPKIVRKTRKVRGAEPEAPATTADTVEDIPDSELPFTM